VGGICYPVHPQIEKPAIFIYDGYPGGVGLAEYGFGRLEALLDKTLSLIQDCSCLDGCPSCVHSPKCGSGNKPLDKRAAQFILEWLLGRGTVGAQEGEARRKQHVPRLEEVAPAAPEWMESEAVAQARHPVWLMEALSRHRILFLDLETQRSAEEVGGWQNKHLMRLAVAVIYDSQEDSFSVFQEGEVHDLIAKLKTADLVIGFNIVDFDYQVLKGYSPFRFSDLKTFDILQEVSRHLGYRLSLNHLAHKTLNMEKTADGLQSLQWFKEGKIAEVTAYCQKDVEITRDLFLFGLANRHLLFETKQGQRVRLPVDWSLSQILPG
jgi:DEAD/DEAH box helicase domain-containing protein